jgi:hypothetical protein
MRFAQRSRVEIELFFCVSCFLAQAGLACDIVEAIQYLSAYLW